MGKGQDDQGSGHFVWTLQIQLERFCSAEFACIEFRFLSFVNMSKSKKESFFVSLRALQTFFLYFLGIWNSFSSRETNWLP